LAKSRFDLLQIATRFAASAAIRITFIGSSSVEHDDDSPGDKSAEHTKIDGQ
jgi:hypothetical protein